MEIRKRLIVLIDHVADPRRPWNYMERVTGISGLRWRSAYKGSQRANDEMFAAIGEHWPEYVCWLITGKVEIASCQKPLVAEKFSG